MCAYAAPESGRCARGTPASTSHSGGLMSRTVCTDPLTVGPAAGVAARAVEAKEILDHLVGASAKVRSES